MSWNPSEAETTERLAEFGLSYLRSELGADRILIVHPNTTLVAEHGFAELPPSEALQDLMDKVDDEQRASVASDERLEFLAQERAVLTAPLLSPDGALLGCFYADREKGVFEPPELDKVAHFAEAYSDSLAGLVGEAPPPESRRSRAEPLELPNVLTGADTTVPFEVFTRVLVDWL